MIWILVTGGVASGIGKGVAASMVARRWARRDGHAVDYRKVEPCLQTGLAHLPNTSIGEIVRHPDGFHFDGDVARAVFWVPGFVPDAHSDVSLGTLLPDTPTDDADPRLVPRLSTRIRELWPDTDRRVIEVGGTAGEPEHALALRMLVHAFGPPCLHIHVTTLVQLPCGRWSSKPAQAAVDLLSVAPDHVFVRGHGPLAGLLDHIGRGARVVGVEEADWPELAWHEALGTLLESDPDPVIRMADGPVVPFDIVSDAPLEGYASLVTRLRAWTGGRCTIKHGGHVVRIGESLVPDPGGAFSIVPTEQGLDAREPARRPDWQGTADMPEGRLAEWLKSLPATPAPTPLAYAVPGFADVYMAHSRAGRLRDHDQLEAQLSQLLPASMEGKRVLDIGCGDGRLAARFAELGAVVTGIEPSAPMAAAAKIRKLERFTLIEGRIEDVNLDGPFDLAVAWMSLDHCPSPQLALERIARVLKPGGRVIVTTEHPIRTAAADSQRKLADGTRVRDYTSVGPRTYQWFGRPEPVTVWHHPLGDWVAAARGAGLQLTVLAEPATPEDHGVPRFQLLCLEKPN